VIGNQEEVCPLSRRIVSQSVFRPLQSDVRFLLYPLPASPLHDLAAWLPQGSNAGLPRSTCVTEWVRSLLLYRRPFRPRRVRMEHPFQPQPRSLTASLTPSFLTILERGSHQLTLPLTLAPIRLDAGRNILPSRFRCPSCDGGTHCPRASRRVVTESPYLVGYCQRDGRSGRVVLAGQFTHAASCRDHS
jgi:hypothetical protein